MDLFWLDKSIVKAILNLTYYKFFLITFGGLVGTFLYCGTFKERVTRK
ncbi:hypothetical protein P9J83_14790 [Clostridium sporogenes]|uniref:Uncharacterized protein n=1 Tax=Clostridium sporogenes TaxID=1509 RepID=A0AAE4FM47_CLOSG|nr:hypothetical protein [Clostridium sporogenes]MDS1004751.1 hypothetical protein [Clostridium sporogenes]